jgi:shikimate dehydrogenase
MRRYGLIGYPLSHSFSKKYFTEKFEREHIGDAVYELYPLDSLDSFKELLDQNPELQGLNVTIPYKETILPFLDILDASAQKIQAVNTIKIRYVSGKRMLTGYNTDTFGFRQSIKPFLESHHERALIFGTGGASKAVASVLRDIGVECYFVSRTCSAQQESARQNRFSYEEVTEHVLRHFPLLINTTPLGMYPNIQDALPIPYQHLGDRHFLYDLIYNPEVTRFLEEGKKQGAQTLNGLSMLQQQAEKAWEIWNE